MFERFTDRARRVVVLAQEESRLLDHNYIGTEHILLGLMHEGDGAAALILTSFGISLVDVRSEVVAIIGRGASAPSGHIPFTARAKKVLEMSLREALQLGHNYIGTEHILLGLVREGHGVAAQVLGALGVDLLVARERMIEFLAGSPEATGLSHGSQVIHSAIPRPSAARCSFCRRVLSEVEHYAAGRNAAICDACIVAARAALDAADDQPIIVLPPIVSGAAPPDDPTAVETIAAAIRAAVRDRPDTTTANVRITEVRFISPALAEVRFSWFLYAVDTGDDPRVATATREGDRWIVDLGTEHPPDE